MGKYKKILTLLFLVALPLFSQVDINKVIAKLDSEIAEERSAAISYLGLIKCREAVKPLHDILEKHNGRDNYSIANALMRIGDHSSILPIVTWIGYFGDEELEENLLVIDPSWRERNEIKTYIKELIEEHLVLPNKEKENEASDLLEKIAFLNTDNHWLFSILSRKEIDLKESLDRLVYKISISTAEDNRLALSLPYTECVYDFKEYFDRLHEDWRKQESFQNLIPLIEDHINKLTLKINSTRKKDKKGSLLNYCETDIENLREFDPPRVSEIVAKIYSNPKNNMTLRLLCLEEWLKGSGAPNYEIFDDFVKKNMPRLIAGELGHLHSCIEIFIEKKDKRVVPLLIQILSDEKEESNKEKASFRINCMDDLAELDKDKAIALLKKKVSELLNKDNLEYDSPSLKYLRIASQVGITDDPDLLLEMLKKEQLISFALNELQRIKPVKALPVLRDFIMTHQEYKWQAAGAIVQIAGKDAFPQLQELSASLLAGQDEKTRSRHRGLASMIIKANDPRGAYLIWEWLDHFDEQLAIKSDEFPKEKVENKEMEANRQAYLEKEAKESNSNLLRRMIEALGRWKEKKAIDVIKRYVNNPSPGVRAYAEWAIRQLSK